MKEAYAEGVTKTCCLYDHCSPFKPAARQEEFKRVKSMAKVQDWLGISEFCTLGMMISHIYLHMARTHLMSLYELQSMQWQLQISTMKQDADDQQSIGTGDVSCECS